MKRQALTVVACVLMAGVAGPARAMLKPDVQDQIRKELMARSFVAKVDLYQARVDETGDVDTEPDREAIKVGKPIIFTSIHFGPDSIKVILKHPVKNNKTFLRFKFNQDLSDDFSREREVFEKKMLPAVFDEKPGGQPPTPEAPPAAAPPANGSVGS